MRHRSLNWVTSLNTVSLSFTLQEQHIKTKPMQLVHHGRRPGLETYEGEYSFGSTIPFIFNLQLLSSQNHYGKYMRTLLTIEMLV